MGYVKLLIALSWIVAVFGIIQQVRADRMLQGRGLLWSRKVQNIATFSWAIAYALLTISMMVFMRVKA